MTNQTPAVLQKDITDQVTRKVSELQNEGLALPNSYSPANALKSAFFAMTNASSGNLLEKCSKESIANALLDMVIQGLSPAKTQCYFVPYGQILKMTRSYFGTMAVLKRLEGVKDIWANVIYKDDVFDYAIAHGREQLIKHETKFENRDKDIVGAYAIIESEAGDQFLTVMTKNEIDMSWSKAKTKNVQKDFPQEMAKRTVINRAAKAFINTSDDSDLLIDAVNRSTENEYEDNTTRKEAEIVEEINNEANQEEFITESEIIEPADIVEESEVKAEQLDLIHDEGDPF